MTTQQLMRHVGIGTERGRDGVARLVSAPLFAPLLAPLFGPRPFRLRSRRRPESYVWLGALATASMLALMARRFWSHGRGRRVRDVMIDDVATIEGSQSVIQAAERMRDHNVGVLPIVENGQVRGLVTDRDLVVRVLARGADPRSTKVVDVATKDVVSARPEWPVDDAMEIMAARQIGRLPVVDGDNRLVGIVTLSSLALRGRDEAEALETAQQVSRRSARA